MSNYSEKDKIKKPIWNHITNFILNRMKESKGVIVPNLGTFTFTNSFAKLGKACDIEQRPIFLLSEKICNNFKIESGYSYLTEHVSLVKLNISCLANDCGCDRYKVEEEIKKITTRFYKSLSLSKNVDLVFSRIGKLCIRGSKSKMKFFTSFMAELNFDTQNIKKIKNRENTANSITTNCSYSGDPIRIIGSGSIRDHSVSNLDNLSISCSSLMETNSLHSFANEKCSTNPHTTETVPEGTEINPNKSTDMCKCCLQKTITKNDEALRNERSQRTQKEDQNYYEYIMTQKKDFENTQNKMQTLKKMESQKVAAFNLGISEAINSLKKQRPSTTNGTGTASLREIPNKRDDYFFDLNKQIAQNSNKKTKEKQILFQEENCNLMKLAKDFETFNHTQEKRRKEDMESYRQALNEQLAQKAHIKQEATAKNKRNEIESCVAYLQLKRPQFYDRKIAEKNAKENFDKARAAEEQAALEKIRQQNIEKQIISETQESLKGDLLSRYLREKAMQERNATELIDQALKKHQIDQGEREKAHEGNKIEILEQCDKYERCARCTRSLNNKHRRNFFPHYNSKMGGMYII